MMTLAYIAVGIYIIALVYITFYCLLQFHLLYYYKKKKQPFSQLGLRDNLPMVTIQLPIFNELYVAERLIDNIVQMDYPKDRLQIQVLDDSTDDTATLTKRKVAQYAARGYDIEWIHRSDRSGYKAGALKAAMPQVKGSFIAIFDADFLPHPDFLQKTIPHFEDPKVGVVQSRWEHINENYSLITRLQAMQLNVHFRVEQTGRAKGNCLLQFNGTAGVWRKETIDDAGGWEADTLTEDLDLSYRAQLKGWRIHYLEDLGSPAELPAEMNGLKSQQFRWMKGGAENARKLIPAVLRSTDLSLRQKIHAVGHLLASTIYLFIFLAGVFSVPLLLSLQQLGLNTKYFAIFLSSMASII
ncbi:MAG TPA: glycosyltransferase, partial [Phaeodactylibacter sp.]|nr:glycosyltransferase [Phaeodactylibacter sp.]